MKKVFELPVVEIFELSSDEIMDIISGDKVDYPILKEETEGKASTKEFAANDKF